MNLLSVEDSAREQSSPSHGESDCNLLLQPAERRRLGAWRSPRERKSLLPIRLFSAAGSTSAESTVV